MKKFALIGHPVAGSLSPALFNAAYAGRYPYDLIDAPFEDAWSRFLSSYDGINITAPYKQDAFAAVDWLSPGASACGAVNLVVKSLDGELWGYNTDVDGVMGAVRECGLAVSRALVLGAGGAARAAVAAAQQLGCSEVVVANRTHEKAVALAAVMGCQVVALADISRLSPDLIIYTIPGDARSEPDMTSPGMTFSVIPGLTGHLLRNAVVLEAEYKHPSLASMPCKRYIPGVRWLLWQAVAGYQLFTGEQPDCDAMAREI